MKLTLSMKNQIVSAVMADVPDRDWFKEAKDLVLPAVVAKLPAPIRRIYDDNLLSPYLKHVAVRPRSTHTLTVSVPTADTHPVEVLEGMDAGVRKKFEALGLAMREARNTRMNMQGELLRSFKMVTTLKQFEEAFPELKKYLPTPQRPVPNLPATTDLMDNLKKIGWLKDGTRTANK